MKKLLFALAASALLLTGCGTLIPKRVEFFQDKVHAFPEQKSREKETQREAAALAESKAEQTLVAAVSNNAPAAVTVPAQDTVTLTKSVSTSLGPPAKPWSGDTQALATKLDSSVAAFNKRLDEFKKDNNENTGKKIEGTGLFRIPYFVWLGGVVLFVLVLYMVGKFALSILASTNPPVALGLSGASAAASTLKKGFGQVVAGGESFLASVKAKYSPEVSAEIEKLFKQAHHTEQDSDVKAAVSALKTG